MTGGELALVEGNSTAISSPVEVRVAIADGQALVRAGFRALLEGHVGISVVGEAGDCAEAIALGRRSAPDVLLIDFELPGAGAIEVTRLLVAEAALAHIRVVMLSAGEPGEGVVKALRAGVSGFLLKDTATGDLVDALRSVAGGHGALSPSIARRVMEEVASLPERDGPTPEDLDELTAREREVMALVAGGLSNHEIAERLVVTSATAKTHVSRVLRKLVARDRAQLVTIAYETGLVVPGRQRRTRTGAPIFAGAGGSRAARDQHLAQVALTEPSFGGEPRPKVPVAQP
jgi:DNA-binding NarL/FixJ family response regulator